MAVEVHKKYSHARDAITSRETCHPARNSVGQSTTQTSSTSHASDNHGNLIICVEQVEYILYYYMAYSSSYLRGEGIVVQVGERERSD
jgi:hypothetical protein